ncbi:MAG: protein kinase [Gemmatimonadales bacterium]
MATGSDQFARLKSALSDRYAIKREIGSGGMAIVYQAEDLRHQRDVAIKVLRPEVAATLGAERFLREIKTAASLNPPHILVLIDSGQAEDLLFYAMPLVQGDSLREHLRREKQLSLEATLRITREVAGALHHAHELGVVHRDVKPENILLDAGHAVITDFGIAKAVSAAGGERLTQTGIAIGSPVYMSPEQASGQADLDARSDIYSLGCVVYEMLGGEPPFTGATSQAILARKSLEDVPPLRNVRETVPSGVEAAIERALAKVPADRFETTLEFVEALERPHLIEKPLPGRRKQWAAVTGGLALILAGYLTISAVRGREAADTTYAPQVVVLPFENLGTADDAYFADGITEEITARLAQLSGLGVKGRTSALQYRDTDKTIQQLGAELGVDYVLEGAVRWLRSDGGESRVRVSPQLIRVADDTHVWAEPYEGTVSDVFVLQAEIAEHVARALDIEVLEPERRALRTVPTENPEALDAYLRANQYHLLSSLTTDRRRAIGLLQRAIELDPDFAAAHARLAVHYAKLARSSTGDDALRFAKHHAERALELDPDLAWGHLANAHYVREKHLDTSLLLPHLKLAEAADPSSGEILLEIGKIYGGGLGDWQTAASYFQRALELDPLAEPQVFYVGFAHFAMREHSEAEPYLQRAIELAPDHHANYLYLAWLYLSWRGDTERAVNVLRSAVEKLGLERAIVAFDWWISRLLAKNEWYRGVLTNITLGSPDLDTASYYLHKASLFDGLSEPERARAYFDSAATTLQAQIQNGESAQPIWLHARLAVAYAGLGETTVAIQEGRRALELGAEDWNTKIYTLLTMAHVYAQVGEYETALETFKLVMAEPNYVTPALLSIDPKLAPMRQLPEFAESLQTD